MTQDRRTPYLMAHPVDDVERALWAIRRSDDSWPEVWIIAAAVAFLLWVYAMSDAPLVWPLP